MKRGILVLLALSLVLIPAILADEEDAHGAVPKTIYNQILDNFTIIAGLAAVLGVILSALYWKKSKKPKVSNVITYLAAIGFSLVLLYSVAFYLGSGVGEKGIVITESDSSHTLAIHIHADIHPIVCGEELKLPLQTGDAWTQPHTHNQRNYIHWEGKLKSDAEGNILDKTPLKIGTFMDVMGTRFTDTCLGDKCNGDTCNGKPGRVTMNVNGVANTELKDYVWKDGDVITIKFE